MLVNDLSDQQAAGRAHTTNPTHIYTNAHTPTYTPTSRRASINQPTQDKTQAHDPKNVRTFLTTSMPSTTRPKATARPSRWGQGSVAMWKWEPFRCTPAETMETRPVVCVVGFIGVCWLVCVNSEHRVGGAQWLYSFALGGGLGQDGVHM